VVAGDGIEPSTRGFLVRRSPQSGASKPKTAKEFSALRPNRPTDRAYTEPCANRPTEPGGGPLRVNGLRASRPSGDRTGRGFRGPAGLRHWEPGESGEPVRLRLLRRALLHLQGQQPLRPLAVHVRDLSQIFGAERRDSIWLGRALQAAALTLSRSFAFLGYA
jgi:hypothetical protein